MKVQKSKILQEDGSTELVYAQSLKLFGKTVIVTRSASPYSENNQPRPCEETDERSVLLSSWNLMLGLSTTTNAERPWTESSGEQASHCYKQIQNENLNTIEVGFSSTSLPYRNFYGGASYPFSHNPIPEKDQIYSINAKEFQIKYVQKNEPMARSNTGTGDASTDLEAQTGSTGDGDGRCDAETQSGRNESVSRLEFVSKPSDVLSAPDQNKVKCLKGFAPYKRFLAES